MKFLFVLLCSCLVLSCDNDSSKNELAEYFYPQKDESVFYIYRDKSNPLSEEVHRIFTISDSKGDHIVVEIYTGEGRILEAYNYNMDSLTLDDHMVVNGDLIKTKADLLKTHLYPMNLSDEAYFATRFQGFYDSTFILKEVKRKAAKKPLIELSVMDEKVEAIVFDDEIRQTLFNPFTQKENVLEGKAKTYFAKGYGLVEWHDVKKKHHFVLEQVFNEQEGAKLLIR